MSSSQSPRPPRLMGILNITPDSFSDGGRYLEREAAVARALRMLEEGADILDIGGESTRPGSAPVPPEEQERRILDVIRQLRDCIPARIPLSIDTTWASVARAALAAGADWINDTSAGLDDPDMLPLAAELQAPIVLMHRRGTPRTMQRAPEYRDVVVEVRDHLAARAEAALAAGVRECDILLDPGIGFGKDQEHNLKLLAGLGRLVELGFPVLLGTSRKRFLGALCGDVAPDERVAATCATTALAVMQGVDTFRVHDVAANRQAADVAWAIACRSTGE
ncbi:dihydropteroate synthase [Allochromatium vinosum]|uniref:Dihydropteroate synthase n=1 Tax=Allochromatium vinosum (strain ATCC 17899 / DSM 180 / NBRC 103801 / NCIMB 10441 / D) TaxID=572477 RepID=D3RVB6_ALLVD|nr:dihydropteroate synthase [Allochromatium vinosum]ADC63048.1 dihydropteroate synthase [Allochromatium vinosum DSM 180]